MESLPIYMQWIVSLATVLSSIGVIVAFVQLRISGNQFKQQLKLTEEQFRLLNQGYIQLAFNQLLYTSNAEGNFEIVEEIDFTTLYHATALRATLQNVGNMPIKMDIKHCIVYSNQKEIYRSPRAIFETVNTMYPQASMPFNFGMFSLGEEGLNLAQLTEHNFTFDLLIEYHDFNDSRIKSINRGMALIGAEILIKRNDDVI